ncbi:MAG TPA: hypothetical protein VJT78_05115 [Candidatus Dormibacteraeota bacterium]|nr:hypothetical protein [Candidatus Dormibacteraeota bacterium]
MRLRTWSFGAVMLLAFAASAINAVPASAAGSVVVVTHDGQHGWQSRVTDANGVPNPAFGSVTFVVGPATPPRGVGSLRLMTNLGMGDGSAQMRNSNYSGTLLSRLTALDYWAYHNFVAASGNQQQWPYLSLNVSCAGCTQGPGDTSNTDTLFFEPPFQQPLTGGPDCSIPGQNPTITNKWQQWDALGGCWWDNGGELGTGGTNTKRLSDFIVLHPDATIFNPNGLGGLRLAVGFASAGDTFDGNIDMVTVGVGGNSTSYDFEPPPPCRDADANGDFHGNHGDGDVKADNDNCEETGHGGNGEGNDNVQSSNRGDGKDFHSTTIDSTSFDSTANTMTITGLGVSGGSPVAFTMVVLESGPLTPGWVSMAFSDGYTNAGDLSDGGVVLH